MSNVIIYWELHFLQSMSSRYIGKLTSQLQFNSKTDDSKTTSIQCDISSFKLSCFKKANKGEQVLERKRAA